MFLELRHPEIGCWPNRYLRSALSGSGPNRTREQSGIYITGIWEKASGIIILGFRVWDTVSSVAGELVALGLACRRRP